MARGPKKPKIGFRKNYRSHNETNTGGKKRRLLDTGRQKNFVYDLEETLEKSALTENKGIISATIQNKLLTQSLDDALEYLKKVQEKNNMTDSETFEIKRLMERYSCWR